MRMEMDPLTYAVFGLYSAIIVSSVFNIKLPAQKLFYRFSDALALILFVSAFYRLNSGKASASKSKGLVYFAFMTGMLVSLYLFNVNTNSNKWLVYDALVVGGILSCFTGEPFSLYFKTI